MVMGRWRKSLGQVFDSIAICAIPIRGIKELSDLVLIIFTAYIDIYCGRNQKPVPPIPALLIYMPSGTFFDHANTMILFMPSIQKRTVSVRIGLPLHMMKFEGLIFIVLPM